MLAAGRSALAGIKGVNTSCGVRTFCGTLCRAFSFEYQPLSRCIKTLIVGYTFVAGRGSGAFLLFGVNYGGLRLVGVSDVWIDFHAGAPVFWRPEQRYLLQYAAPSGSAASQATIHLPSREQSRRA